MPSAPPSSPNAQKCCTPQTLGSYTTNGSDPDRANWDLSQYQKPGVGSPGAQYRLIEIGYGLEHGSGTFGPDGRPENLPDQFHSTYDYDGFMELQQGCTDPETGETIWP